MMEIVESDLSYPASVLSLTQRASRQIAIFTSFLVAQAGFYFNSTILMDDFVPRASRVAT